MKRTYLNTTELMELPIDTFNKALEHTLIKYGEDLKTLHQCECGRKYYRMCIHTQVDNDFSSISNIEVEKAQSGLNN